MSTISKVPRLKLSIEAISFQNDNTGARLEEQITSIVVKIKNKTYKDNEEVSDSVELGAIKDILMTRFGLKMDIDVDSMLAAILPFYSNRHHIFLNKDFLGVNEREAIRILKSGRELKGTVNVDTARVSGVFSEYPNYLFMNFREQVLVYDLTSSEITAALLHEVGHAFEACEYADRLETCNQIMADVFKEVSGRKDKTDMKYVYHELKKINPELTEKEVELLTGDNKTIAGYYWFKFMVGSVQSQMPVRKYDETSFEALSDNFVTRLGYGRHLVTALEKLHRKQMGHPNSVLQKFVYWMQVFNLYTALVIGAVTISSALIALAINPLVFINLGLYYMAMATIVWINGDAKKDMTYDDLRDRYKRVRNDVVATLKNYKLPDEQVKMFIGNIKAIDRLIAGTNSSKNAYNQVAWLLFPSNRRADASVKEQRLIEDLIANDLFVKAAELRTA